MIPWFRPAVATLLVAGLAACGASPPMRYHGLSAAAPGPSSPGSAALLVEVLPVIVPERVNRDEIVLTAADGQLDVRDDDRWAGPLTDEIRQLINDALWQRLRAADSYAAPVALAPDGVAQYRLALRIERFDAIPNGQAVVEASWTLRRLPQGRPAICRAGTTESLAGVVPQAAVAALSVAAKRVAAMVAASLDRLHQGSVDLCSGS